MASQGGGLVLWSGGSVAFGAALVRQVPLVLRGVEVFNIDCAIRFNAFLIADEAVRLGVPAEEVLRRVRVQRAFTPYQILDVLCRVRAEPGRAVYFLLAPCKQFFDGDVGQEEAVFLLNKMLGVIRDLRARSVPLLIVERPEYRNVAFAPTLRRLRAMADHVRELPEAASGGGDWRSYSLPEIHELMGQRSLPTGRAVPVPGALAPAEPLREVVG